MLRIGAQWELCRNARTSWVPLEDSKVHNEPIPPAPLPHVDEPAPSLARGERARDVRREESYGCLHWYDCKRRPGDSPGSGAGQARGAELRG